MVHLSRFNLDLTLAAPALPYHQLLAVLPPKSSHLLPPALRPLMTGVLREYFPLEFGRIPDRRGREWRELLLLGFVDMAAVEAATMSVEGGTHIGYV